MLTTKDIANLHIHSDLSKSKHIAALCRGKVIYAYRDDSPFSSWVIPVQSFARFLRYYSVYLEPYLNKYKTGDNLGDDSMSRVIKSINKALDRDPKYNESYYTIPQLSDIFGLPENQIWSLFAPQKGIKRLILVAIPANRSKVSINHILEILDQNPDRLAKLEERHRTLLEQKDNREGSVRHILMLYAYYRDRKCLI